MSIKIEGTYENQRNRDHSDLYKAIIRECYGVTDVIIAHHLTYVKGYKENGFDYEVVEEIPSADCLIFDHEIASRIWGFNFKDVLVQLAKEPTETRDALLKKLYEERAL